MPLWEGFGAAIRYVRAKNRECGNKNKYRTQYRAEKQAESLLREKPVFKGKVPHAYKCRFCDFWYVGNTKWISKADRLELIARAKISPSAIGGEDTEEV